MDIKKIQTSWLKKEKEKLSGTKNRPPKRTYRHFDSPIGQLTKEKADKICFKPEIVSRHSFYPFIGYTKINRKRAKMFEESKWVDDKSSILKEREIKYAAHKDALIYSWYSHLLSIPYEEKIKKHHLDKNITAYRARKTTKKRENNVDFAKEVFDFIKNHEKSSAIVLDITGFFDNINHKKLKKVWSKLISKERLPDDHYNVFKSITNFAYVKKDDLNTLLKNEEAPGHKICRPRIFRNVIRKSGKIKRNDTNKGVPQGAQLSALLSNAYMLEFDIEMNKLAKQEGGMYRRYSDDIIIVLPGADKKMVGAIAKQTKNLIKNKNGLEIKQEKEETRYFIKNNGRLRSYNTPTGSPANRRKLTYLGIETDGEYEYIRSRTINRFYRRVKKAIKQEVLKYFKYNVQVSRKTLYKKFTQKFRDGSNYQRMFLDYVEGAAKKLSSNKIRKQINDKKVIKFIKDRIEEEKKKTKKYHYIIKQQSENKTT